MPHVDVPPHLGPLDPVVSRLIKRLTGSRGRGDIEWLMAARER
jgi:hypothetical protein